jgi:hypothetical protein
MGDIAHRETLLFLTPAAYESAYTQGRTVRADTGAIDEIGRIIAREFPDKAMPVVASDLSMIMRGSPTDSRRKWISNWDEFFDKAGLLQSYIPAGELDYTEGIGAARSVTKQGIISIGRPVLEVTVHAWDGSQSTTFVNNWIALRLSGSAAEKAKQQAQDAWENIPLIGSATRARKRVLREVANQGLEPFIIGRRETPFEPEEQHELPGGTRGQQAVGQQDRPELPPGQQRLELPGPDDRMDFTAVTLGLIPLLRRLLQNQER